MKKHLLVGVSALVAGLVSPGVAYAQPQQVAMLHAVSDPFFATCTVDLLWCTGDFDVVDLIDVAAATPTLEDLAVYDAVMVYGDVAFADPVALGDVLASYVEIGGGLVLNVGPLCDGVTAISGRLVSQGLMPVTPGTWSAPGGGLSIAVSPGHQWLPGPIEGHQAVYGVNRLNGNDSVQCGGMTPTENATLVAEWTNGEDLVVALEPPDAAFGRVAAVNFFPPADACMAGPPALGWDSSGDGDRLMSQPLLWAMSYVKGPATTYNTEFVQDLNCNSLDVDEEPTIDITLDPDCENNLDPVTGEPIDNNDFYFDFYSHQCAYFTPSYDQDLDFLGGGSISIQEGSGQFPDETIILTCDNCPADYNPDQADQDGDALGDLCDNCVHANNPMQENADSDCHGNACDNCFLTPNPDQKDTDGDFVGDACDNCIELINPDQVDCDLDDVGDDCDNCVIVEDPADCGVPSEVHPKSPNPDQLDSDFDGLGDTCDNCPFHFQDTDFEFQDSDKDGIGNLCDVCPNDDTNGDNVDSDSDGVGDACDNCPLVYNADGLNEENQILQNDADNDGVGDACDNCVTYGNPRQEDTDGDGVGGIDADDEMCDICPLAFDPAQADGDGDTYGDGCDNCPNIANDQDDRDEDGFGDACDFCRLIPSVETQTLPDGSVLTEPNNFDSDNDGVGDICDNCPYDANPVQEDDDLDGLGNMCDLLGIRGGGDVAADVDKIQRTGSCSTTGGSIGFGWVLGLAALAFRRRR